MGNFFSGIGTWFNNLVHPQAKPQPQPKPQPRPVVKAPNLGEFLHTVLVPAAKNIARPYTNMGKLVGLDRDSLNQQAGAIIADQHHQPTIKVRTSNGGTVSYDNSQTQGANVLKGLGVNPKTAQKYGAAAQYGLTGLNLLGAIPEAALAGRGAEAAAEAGRGVRAAEAAGKVVPDTGKIKVKLAKPADVPAPVEPVPATPKTAKLTVAPNGKVNLKSGMSAKVKVARIADPDINPVATGAEPTKAQLAGIPKVPVKKVSAFDKAIRSTSGILKRMGEPGQKISDMLTTARDTHNDIITKTMSQMPTVMKLKGKEAKTFGHVVEGKLAPVSERQAQAVNEWKTVAPQLRERAVAAGLDVGNQGETYFPHTFEPKQIDKNFNTYVSHLVNSGQAKTPEEAIQLLNYAKDVSRNRQFGNLEAPRIVDLPGYKTHSANLAHYVQAAAHRIAQAETFGAKDEKVLPHLARIIKQGGDGEAAREAFNVASGAKRYNPTAMKVSNGLRKFNTLTKLGTAAISNATQSTNTAAVAGYFRTARAMAKGLTPEGRTFVEKSGVASHTLINDLAGQQGVDGWIGKIGAPGFGTVEKANRSISALAGRRYAIDLATKGDAKSLEVLRTKLGVKGEIGKTLTEEQQIQAARRMTDLTQFQTGAQDLPGWASSPLGKLVAQFRTFSYKQGEFMLNEVLKPVAKGNVAPMARFLAALPLGYAAYESKNILRNRPDDPSPERQVFQSFKQLGGLGLGGDLVEGLMPRFGKYLPPGVYASQVAGTLGGPTISTAGRIADATGSAMTKGDFTPAGRIGLGTIPVIGGTLSNTLLPYQNVGNRTNPQLPGSSGATASASSSAPVSEAQAAYDQAKAKLDQSTGLADDTSSPEYKAFKKAETALKKSQVEDGSRLGGTDTLDSAQQRIDTATKKLPDGMSKQGSQILTRYAKLNDAGREKFNADPKNRYNLARAKYEEDTKGGKLSELDKFKRLSTLGKMKVTSGYSDEAVALQGMSKANRTAFLGENPEYGQYMDEAAQLDQELANKGWIKKAKLGSGGSENASGRAAAKRSVRLQGRLALPSYHATAAPRVARISARKYRSIKAK
jgi:hypothetical protein